MNVLSSKEAERILLSWKRSQISVKLIVTGISEIAGVDLVAIFDVDPAHHTVQLTSGPRGYGLRLDECLITGDDDSLDIAYPGVRYLLVRAVAN